MEPHKRLLKRYSHRRVRRADTHSTSASDDIAFPPPDEFKWRPGALIDFHGGSIESAGTALDVLEHSANQAKTIEISSDFANSSVHDALLPPPTGLSLTQADLCAIMSATIQTKLIAETVQLGRETIDGPPHSTTKRPLRRWPSGSLDVPGAAKSANFTENERKKNIDMSCLPEPNTVQGATTTSVVLPTPLAIPSSCMNVVQPMLSSVDAGGINSQASCADLASSDVKYNIVVEACVICCCDIIAGKAVCLECSHGWYCLLCMQQHVEAKLERGCVEITCPECNSVLAEYELKRLLPQEIIDRILVRSLEQAVSSTPDLRACPTPNCPMRFETNANRKRLNCPICRKSSCLKCGSQPFHNGRSCQEHLSRMDGQKQAEASLRVWMEETGAKQCPTCQMIVTKQNLRHQKTQRHECHKMMCANCRTRFCFKCLSLLTETRSCSCTQQAHGFIDPHTGKIIAHRRRHKKIFVDLTRPKAKAKTKAKAKAKANAKAKAKRTKHVLNSGR